MNLRALIPVAVFASFSAALAFPAFSQSSKTAEDKAEDLIQITMLPSARALHEGCPSQVGLDAKLANDYCRRIAAKDFDVASYKEVLRKIKADPSGCEKLVANRGAFPSPLASRYLTWK